MKVNRFLIFLLIPPFFSHAADDSTYEMVLAAAPVEVQALPKILNDPKERADYPYSCMALVGPPGVGKTTMAYAVAHKAGWEPCFISNGHLADKFRNSSSRKLQEIFDGVLFSNEKTLIILDEFNAMVENHDSANHDTDTLSRTIWSFLDSQQKNDNVFVMATMNRINKIPAEMKERLLGSVVRVDNLKDIPRIKTCFLTHLLSHNLTVGDDLKPYIAEKFAKFGINNPRRIERCAQIIKRYALDRHEERPVELTRSLVDCGFDQYKRNLGLMDFDKKEISDEERRFQASQELQKEQMRISQEQFESSQQLHRKQFNMNFGMSVLTFAAQTGFAAWHAYTNSEQFAQTAKWHAAGMLANSAQLANSKYQFDATMQFNEKQFEANQENARAALILSGATFSKQTDKDAFIKQSDGSYQSSNAHHLGVSAKSVVPEIQKQVAR